jgi:hypothetical protein
MLNGFEDVLIQAVKFGKPDLFTSVFEKGAGRQFSPREIEEILNLYWAARFEHCGDMESDEVFQRVSERAKTG